MECMFCSRVINNKGSLISHQKHCKSNPDYVSKGRSPHAGAKKGSVGWSKGLKVGPHERWLILYPDEHVFCENSTYPRNRVKKRIMEQNLIPYNCAICSLEPMWNNKPLVLILDHINGVNNDNRLTNLRFVCSNCDSQLPTYKSKNKKII